MFYIPLHSLIIIFHSREFLTNTTDFGRTEKLDLLSESVTETGFFKQAEPID